MFVNKEFETSQQSQNIPHSQNVCHTNIIIRKFHTNLYTAIQLLFNMLASKKALILGPIFDHFFDPILGPPLGEPFGPPCPPRCRPWPPQCRFWSLFGTPLGAKMGPWSAHWRPRGAKRLVLRVTLEVPFASWSRLVVPRGPESHSYRLGDPLG